MTIPASFGPVSPGVTALGARLAPPATGNSASAEELRKAAQAFEAIFIRQMLSAARSADFGGEEALLGGPGLEQFTAMRDDHFAEIVSQRGTFGMAAMIERHLAGQLRQQGE